MTDWICENCGSDKSHKRVTWHGAGKLFCGECVERKNEPLTGVWSRRQKREITTDPKKYLQPFKKDGIVNKDFAQVYGTQSIEREYKIPKKEIQRQIERYG